MFKIPAFISLLIDSAIIIWQIHLLSTTAIVLNFHHEVIYFDVCLAGINHFTSLIVDSNMDDSSLPLYL
jgi:hypothetical protein